MRTISMLAVAACVTLSACGKDDQPAKPAHPVPGSYAAAVTSANPKPAGIKLKVELIDFSKIKTFEDYQAAKDAAWNRYESAKGAAWQTYSAARDKELQRWTDQHTAIASRFRSASYADYLQWLDLHERGDFDGIRRMLHTSPTAAAYLRDELALNQADTAEDAKTYASYDTAEQAAFKVYETDVQHAWQAYESNQSTPAK